MRFFYLHRASTLLGLLSFLLATGCSQNGQSAGAPIPKTVLTGSDYSSELAAVSPKKHPHQHKMTYSSGIDQPAARTKTFESYGGNGAPYPFGSWANAAPYVDIVRANGDNIRNDAEAAHIPVLGYVDINRCSGSKVTSTTADSPGPGGTIDGSVYYAGNQNASPDCSKFANTDYYSQTLDEGVNVWTIIDLMNGCTTADDKISETIEGHTLTLNRPLVTPGYYNCFIEQHFIDPGSSSAQSDFAAYVDTNLYGKGLTYVLVDDTFTPAEVASYAYICNGLNESGSTTDCDEAPGGRAEPGTPSNLNSFNSTEWDSGMQKVFNILGEYGLTPVANGISGELVRDLNPAGNFGGFCECFFDGNGSLYANELAGIAKLTAAHEPVVIQNDGANDVGSRLTGLAAILQNYDYRYTYEAIQDTSLCDTANSTIQVCPEAAFVAWNPLNSYSLVNNGATQPVYRRDFADCANPAYPVNSGTVYPNGPPIEAGCTAILNPSYASVTLDSSLLMNSGQSYGSNVPYTLSISSNGSYCGCFGDPQGSLGVTQTSFPITLKPGQGIVLLDYTLPGERTNNGA